MPTINQHTLFTASFDKDVLEWVLVKSALGVSTSDIYLSRNNGAKPDIADGRRRAKRRH